MSIVRVNFVEAYYLIAVNCHLTLQRYRGSSSGSRSESETPPHWRTELNKTKSYKRNSEDELRDRYEHTLPRHSYLESVTYFAQSPSPQQIVILPILSMYLINPDYG